MLTRVLADHVFEAQTLSRFMVWLRENSVKKYTQAELEGIFLANHKSDYMSSQGKFHQAQRSETPDYTKDGYKGSLLQHMMCELGSLDNPDRMALITGSTNNRKGKVWKLDEITGDIEVAYDLARINNYMIMEKDAFCATLDGSIRFSIVSMKQGSLPNQLLIQMTLPIPLVDSAFLARTLAQTLV